MNKVASHPTISLSVTQHGVSSYEHQPVVHGVHTLVFLIAVKYQQGFQGLPCNWGMVKAGMVSGNMVLEAGEWEHDARGW